MAIKAGWQKHEEGWQERYNQLIGCVNTDYDPTKIRPKLTKDEMEWYKQKVRDLQSTNRALAAAAKKGGVKPPKTYYPKI